MISKVIVVKTPPALSGIFSVHSRHSKGVVRLEKVKTDGLRAGCVAYSGYEMDERYGLDIYRTVDREKMHVVMDLCIPIK